MRSTALAVRLLLAAVAAAALVAVPTAAEAAKPLPVVLFGESLCDDTAHFIVDVLGAQSSWHSGRCRNPPPPGQPRGRAPHPCALNAYAPHPCAPHP